MVMLRLVHGATMLHWLVWMHDSVLCVYSVLIWLPSGTVHV